LYYLVPCEVISPYVFTGLGGDYYWIKGSPLIGDTHTYDYQANIGVGAGTNLSPDWKVNAEFGVHSVSTKMFDGIPSLIHGRNTVSYATFGVGLTYMFNKGPKSHLCDLYNGLGEIDYHKIDELIKKDQPQPTPVNYDSIASIVKNNMPTVVGNSSESKWALIGINFEFNKATLTPESLPILANTAEILLTNPDINVEIEGNTDNIGSKHYNMELSIRRADVVKDYLISKGVAAGRITTKGMGKDNPVVSNKTAEDRMLNRRVVFIVVK
jgi:outer membrane protein OmpA-like peptidoglycan-associated protein